MTNNGKPVLPGDFHGFHIARGTHSPDDLLAATTGGTAGEYALAGMEPVGGRPLLGSVADDPVGN